MEPTILFEDNHCLAVAKPAPLLTQGVPAGLPTLEAWVKDYLRAKYHKPGNVYLGVPHRLDRPVSGVVLFARNSKAARRLAEQFQQHRVTKVYWAVVEGHVLPEEGVWEDHLRKREAEARTEVVPADAPGAKSAVLHYRVLQPLVGNTLLELRPQTGRMHQLRAQAAVRGHPIRGDVLYGSATRFGPPAELPRDRVIALHGHSLTFLHPIRYEPITGTAPLPDYWHEYVNASPSPPAAAGGSEV
jgi:23S rRNA pseudouridine1911/1915/1917 synthase